MIYFLTGQSTTSFFFSLRNDSQTTVFTILISLLTKKREHDHCGCRCFLDIINFSMGTPGKKLFYGLGITFHLVFDV